eukprot:12889200-Prorocentrum_lima.AAC.1
MRSTAKATLSRLHAGKPHASLKTISPTADAPMCVHCGCEMPGKRFKVMMEKLNNYYTFVDGT